MPTRELRHAIPRVYAGYKEPHDSAPADGVLDARTKELIALAIAVSKECDAAARPPFTARGRSRPFRSSTLSTPPRQPASSPARAAALLARDGRQVSNLGGGMHAWARAGLPVVAKGGGPGRIA